jgi:hypothetical protein
MERLLDMNLSKSMIWIFMFLMSGCTSTRSAYFEQLCKSESGIKIYKRVENVDSVLQMRRPDKFDKVKKPHLYTELRKWAGYEPYWIFQIDPWTLDFPANFPMFDGRMITFKEKELTPVTNYRFEAVSDSIEKYPYIEISSNISLERPCATQFCYNETKRNITEKLIAAVTSRYGFTWEQISNVKFADRIVGMEYRIVDLKTGETLAVARDFLNFDDTVGYGKSGGGGADFCNKPGLGYNRIFMRDFVVQVLKPPLGKMHKTYEEKQ